MRWPVALVNRELSQPMVNETNRKLGRQATQAKAPTGGRTPKNWPPTLISVTAIGKTFPDSQLLKLKAASNQIRLIANAPEPIAQTAEAQRVDCAVIGLQIINPTRHRFRRLNEFVRDSNAT